ncbi:MAG: hypothetical protein H7Y15_05380 [Pseudonocardia sp.]|nr:hypothetical protein [Pseudonocardia sp.]
MSMLDSYLARLMRPLLDEMLAEMNLTPSAELDARTTALEARMTSIEDTVGTELGVLVGVIVAEVESLRIGSAAKDQALVDARAQIESLKANSDGEALRQAEAVQAAVTAALAADSVTDTDRLLGYTTKLKEALPPAVEVPVIEVPQPGAPAEVPVDSTVEVPEVVVTPEPEPTPETLPADVDPAALAENS